MPNDDLISRKALLDSFDVHKVTEYDEAGFAMSYNAVPVKVIEKAPAVDAEPVRHAMNVTEWFESDQFLCSNCGFCCEIIELRYDENGMGEPDAYEYSCKYCPNCGAKIDSKEDAKCTP